MVYGATGGRRSSMVGGTAAAGAGAAGGKVGGGAVTSTKTEGFIMDGGLKMDKEIDKLRNNVQRELGIVNSRLNDGVAASGAEVQELVNAVTATQGDLGRLRELSTYISNGCKNEEEGKDSASSSHQLEKKN
eukprot:8816859-Ditylum_brightwellii.AAC.1